MIDVHLEAERCAFMAVEFSRQLAANGVGMLRRLHRTNIEYARKLAEIVQSSVVSVDVPILPANGGLATICAWSVRAGLDSQPSAIRSLTAWPLHFFIFLLCCCNSNDDDENYLGGLDHLHTLARLLHCSK